MTRTSKTLIAAAALGVAIYALYPRSAPAPADEAADVPRELTNRIWISKVPTSERDKIDILILLDDPTIGLFQTSSAFEGDYTAFEWKAKGGKLRVTMLQSGKQHDLKVAVKRDGCEPFDLCMKVSGAPRGAKRYVSNEDWVFSGPRPDPAALRQLVGELTAGATN